MKRQFHRWWIYLASAAGLLTLIAIVHLGVEYWIAEPPNYSRIDEGLYLGGYVLQPPPRTQAVLNLCESEDPYQSEVHVWKPIRDAEPAPSNNWLLEQVRFIDVQRHAGKVVYVHCRAGVSRSGMVVAAYIMFKNKWTRDEALAFLRSKRPIIRPNSAFMERLSEWEKVIQSQEPTPR
jgi:Dual specificity phosphatase, catalytic domain